MSGECVEVTETDRESMILPTDKGQATVLLDRDDYDKKLQDMLDDTKVTKD